MRLPSHHGRTKADVAMTPMIDVVFQLLIFFICTASFQAAEELLPMGLAAQVESGAGGSNPTEPELERIIVRATQAGGETQWEIHGRPAISLHAVRQALEQIAQADRSRPITLDVSGDVPLGDMIDAYDICRLVGLAKIEFAVEQKSVVGFTTEDTEGTE